MNINNRWTECLMSKYGVAWFKMNESSGNILDSKNGFIGTPYNLIYQVEEGINFNGTSSYIQFSDKVIPIGKKSIYFEIKTSRQGNPEIIMTQTMGSAYNGTQINLGSNGHIYFTLGKGVTGSPIVSVTTPLAFDGNWHKILITWDGTTDINGVKMYIDDMVNPVATTTATSLETLNPSYSLSMGRGHDVANRYYFQGQLKNIQIYNDVIDPIAKFNLIRINDKYYTYKNDEFIEIELTKENLKLYGIDLLDMMTTPTDKVRISMEEENRLGNGKEFSKVFNMTEFKKKFGKMKKINEV
ncbi:LamG domain-containing protein [Tissierella sp.]|uniref:LamG domain-containing protein n=1 Tax=Tissierella sp. TaxID=41274 RepID=UPI0030653F85